VDEYYNLIRRVMWERAGIIRCNESLSIAKRELEGIRHIVMDHYRERKALEVKNMLQCAMSIVESALRRQCSVGAHYRSDYPDRAGCFYNTIAWLESGETIGIGKEPLRK